MLIRFALIVPKSEHDKNSADDSALSFKIFRKKQNSPSPPFATGGTVVIPAVLLSTFPAVFWEKWDMLPEESHPFFFFWGVLLLPAVE